MCGLVSPSASVSTTLGVRVCNVSDLEPDRDGALEPYTRVCKESSEPERDDEPDDLRNRGLFSLVSSWLGSTYSVF